MLLKQFKIYILSLYTLLFAACADFRIDLERFNIRSSCTENPLIGSFQSGTGSVSDPYIICSETQFLLLANNDSFYNDNFIQGRDLNFSSTNFVPVGDSNLLIPFRGSYNAEGRVIRNINYTADVSDPLFKGNAGIFSFIEDASISNIRLEDINVTTGFTASGLLIGRGINSNVSNVVISGGSLSLLNSEIHTGSLVGLMELDDSQNHSITNISNSATIDVYDRGGGIYGEITISNGSDLLLQDITNTGDITQNFPGNTNGGVGGFIRANGSDNTSIVIRNVIQRADYLTSVASGGGSFSGLTFGQIQINSMTNASLDITDVDIDGEFTSNADASSRPGAVGGLIGAMSLGQSNNLNVTISRISVRQRMNIPSTLVNVKDSIGGIIGILAADNSGGPLNVSIEDSFFEGSFNVNAQSNSAGGLIGVVRNFGVNESIQISRSYAYTTSFSAAATPTPPRGLIGGYTGGVAPELTFSNVFFNAPASFIGGEVGGLSGYSEVNLSQLIQQSTYTGWDFSSVWRIQSGVSPPTLR